MGMTIHYRGTLDCIESTHEMEDRVMDLVFALHGKATVWRSFADHDPSRVVRGLIVDMAPGHDTLSLIVSPEGHLTPLFQIEEAEQSAFAEPPCCFVKTQFGSILGHVAIVHLLEALKEQYVSNLEISDEGEYYETRDLQNLRHKQAFLGGAIRSMAEELRVHGLSDEAMEDPDIVAKRIERVAMLVQKKMRGQTGDPLSQSKSGSSNDPWDEPSLEENVQWMDAQRLKNDLRSERMIRRIGEATSQGISHEEAIRLAMRDEGFPEAIDSDVPDAENAFGDCDAEEFTFVAPPHPFDEAVRMERDEQDPAVKSAQGFLTNVIELQQGSTAENGFETTLVRGAMDIFGGLVQATGDHLDDGPGRALAITQLKRALSGHAYARGAVFGLRGENVITKQQAEGLHNQLQFILKKLHELMANAWDEDT